MNGTSCLNSFLRDELKAKLEKVVDRFNKHSGPLTTVLVRDACFKQIYRRGDYRIVIYNIPGNLGATQYAGRFVYVLRGYAEPDHGDLTSEQASKCLARAKEDLLAIGTGADVLDTYRKNFGDITDDPDIGPAHFLNCNGGGELPYERTLTLLVHEVTHLDTKGNCLYTTYGSHQVCFALSNDLPSSSIATVAELFDSDDPYLQKLSKAQRLYLFQFNESNRGPAALFNELNAYTAGLQVSAGILKTKGTHGMLDKGGHPEPQMLPLVMLWTVKYLDEMRAENPDLYSSSFGPSTDNHKSVETLLAHGEDAYRDWNAQLAAHKLSAIPSEKALWQQYLDARKELEHPQS
ncbi:MAG TPA: hypothetical protein VKR29_05500 [Candidatus Binataceae bacterium]|nr:hypothetical protein [Candidatus Binataceae bacterium]